MTLSIPEADSPSFVSELDESGVAVLPGVFSSTEIEQARRQVLENLDLMKNTRAAVTSRHLAGFHHHPQLESLHALITNNATIRSHMSLLCGDDLRTIGLSDITVNRSQQWHKDLLRGKFKDLMCSESPCEAFNGTVFKVILYLQDSDSLKIIPGSHKQDIALDTDDSAIPDKQADVSALSVSAGDAVIIDICTTHRGSTEEAFQSEEALAHPKILISTVFGAVNSPLTDSMETGNAARFSDWLQRHAND